jgi:hypothetical protein
MDDQENAVNAHHRTIPTDAVLQRQLDEIKKKVEMTQHHDTIRTILDAKKYMDKFHPPQEKPK